MGTAKRVIAKLDIKGPNLVKGIHLEGLRVLGKPEAFAKYYFDTGIDELLFMDVVASLYERNSLSEIIRRTASQIFVPLTVGGGLRSIEDIRNALLAGADKVSINTAAIRNPMLIKQAAEFFGSSTIVVTIEAIRQENGKYLAYVDNGRESTGVEVCEWAQQAQDLGAGEIILTSVDREGTGEGYDLDLLKLVAPYLNIPLVASGGAGSGSDAVKAILEGGADAVSLASIIHYEAIKNISKGDDYSMEGNTEFLKKNVGYKKIQPTSISEIKREMQRSGIHCRLAGNKSE